MAQVITVFFILFLHYLNGLPITNEMCTDREKRAMPQIPKIESIHNEIVVTSLPGNLNRYFIQGEIN